VVVKDLRDGAIYIVTPEQWNMINNFQNGVIDDDLKIALDFTGTVPTHIELPLLGTNGPDDWDSVEIRQHTAYLVVIGRS
jgi:hypothetical protein